MLTKVQMVEAIQALPDDATVDDAIERLYVLAKIEIGFAQADAGKVSTQEEARRRMARWLR
jgi:predicted transcriptional regulator